MKTRPHKLRLAYLTNISSPYRIEMVETWARCNPEVEISVYYTDSDDQGRGWDVYPMRGVMEIKLPIVLGVKGYGKLNRGLFNLVRDNDVVMIGGFEQVSYLATALVSKILGRRVILLFDGFSPARFTRERIAVKALKKFTAWLCDAFFANGQVSEIYLKSHIGVNTDKPIYNQYLSHSDIYIKQARKLLDEKNKVEIRKILGMEGQHKILLCCGYLIYRKRIDLVIDALSLVPEDQRPLLLVVGMGPLRETLEIQAKYRNIATHFVGFKQRLDLALYYFASDALILASDDDPWGLVINEAMSAGLPIIVSDACGASFDLVRNDVNGYVFRNRDPVALADAINRLLKSDLSAFGAASREIIDRWTPQQSAANLGRCVSDLTRAN